MIADTSTATRGVPPRAIIWAAWFLWSSVALQFIVDALVLLRGDLESPLWAFLFGRALGVALFLWWMANLLAGRHWTREIFIIASLFCLIYAKSYFSHQLPLAAAGDVVAILRLIRVVLNYGALGFLFAPAARAWFANGKHIA